MKNETKNLSWTKSERADVLFGDKGGYEVDPKSLTQATPRIIEARKRMLAALKNSTK
jgi:hypothetical protein|tara:strand:+ start:24261 stop:24431 length:171 start_codon:yes stop_codon:yes gene_type:complete